MGRAWYATLSIKIILSYKLALKLLLSGLLSLSCLLINVSTFLDTLLLLQYCMISCL